MGEAGCWSMCPRTRYCPRPSSGEQEATARPFLAAAGYCTEQWPLQRGKSDNGAAWRAHVERLGQCGVRPVLSPFWSALVCRSGLTARTESLVSLQFLIVLEGAAVEGVA